jgi:tetratricopeptide (TPR) repeat protein
MRRRYTAIFLVGIVFLYLLGSVVYNLPPVHDRFAWRVDNLLVNLRRFFNPPEQVVFVPSEAQQEQIDTIVGATMAALIPTSATATPPLPTGTPLVSPVPSLTPTPIPVNVALRGIRHEYQKFNNCAPASLSMVLSYWGWAGDQYTTRAYLRPSFELDDKNVNPFEIVDFVENYTGFDAVWRVGGNLDLLKRLVAAGFPVLIEKGLDPPNDAWLGHYQIISGYNDGSSQFLVYDSFEGPPEAYPVPYSVIAQFWRHFNYVYVVVSPPERAADVHSILGSDSNPRSNFQVTADLALTEANALTGREGFFARFNRGASLVYLQDYAGAAQAFDIAFSLYANLPDSQRPWRLLWYRDEPYSAYYHTGRYQDVINLANSTLATADKPVLEETYYWRGMAKAASGDQAGGIEDLRRAYQLNPNSTPASAELRRLGVAVP